MLFEHSKRKCSEMPSLAFCHVALGRCRMPKVSLSQIAEFLVVFELSRNVGLIKLRTGRSILNLSSVAFAFAVMVGTGVPRSLSTVVTAIASVSSNPANSLASGLGCAVDRDLARHERKFRTTNDSHCEFLRVRWGSSWRTGIGANRRAILREAVGSGRERYACKPEAGSGCAFEKSPTVSAHMGWLVLLCGRNFSWNSWVNKVLDSVSKIETACEGPQG